MPVKAGDMVSVFVWMSSYSFRNFLDYWEDVGNIV